MRWPFLCIVLLVAFPAVAAQPADDVYTHGRLYTADQRQ